MFKRGRAPFTCSEGFDFAGDRVERSMTLYAKRESPLCFAALDDRCSVKFDRAGNSDSVSVKVFGDGAWRDCLIRETIDLDKGESVCFSAGGTFGKNYVFFVSVRI